MPQGQGKPPTCPLSKREHEILGLLAHGLTQQQVGQRLGIRYSTVRTTTHNAYVRLGVANLAQAVATMWESGWADPVDTGWVDRRVTAAQYLYLQAFDKLLAARDDEAIDEARRRMRHHLTSMCIESEVEVTPVDNRCVQDRAMERLLAVVLA